MLSRRPWQYLIDVKSQFTLSPRLLLTAVTALSLFARRFGSFDFARREGVVDVSLLLSRCRVTICKTANSAAKVCRSDVTELIVR